MGRVIDIQRRLQEVGRIRLGDRAEGGSRNPRKLQQFRLTSFSEATLQAAASVYGGEVRPWAEAPSEGAFELYTESSTIRIVLPPGLVPYSQAYELWSGGGCQRRCDGENAVIRQKNGPRERKCACNPDDRECKLTTRANFMLPEVPGFGVWRMETHGYNAGVELTAALDLISPVLAGGSFVPGTLRMEPRVRKTPGEPTRRFVVPVLDLDVTIGDLLEGKSLPALTAPALEPVVAGRPQLAPGPPPPDGGTTVPDVEFIDADEIAPPSWGEAPEPPPEMISHEQAAAIWREGRARGVPSDGMKEVIGRHSTDGSTAGIPAGNYQAVIAEVAQWTEADDAEFEDIPLSPVEPATDEQREQIQAKVNHLRALDVDSLDADGYCLEIAGATLDEVTNAAAASVIHALKTRIDKKLGKVKQ